MKCQYVGWFTRQGCNEDAVQGTRFCHAHRSQGPSNETSGKIMTGCVLLMLGAGLLFIVCVVVS